MKKKYAIIDVETTGGKASRDRIIEIAVVIHDGNQILESWESLINPETLIPWNITILTGINDQMVANAPKFYEVARKIVELTEGAIFVAHNARFDYSFIGEEFKRLGYTYTRKQLCTLRLARQTLPGLYAYGLDALSRHFNIHNQARHRAMGDVQATIKVLEYILQHEDNREKAELLINLGIKEAMLPNNLSLELIHSLPEACGVYYFHNDQNEVIYVGKSINIQKRIAEHFADKTEKARKLQEQVHDISFEVTGSELLALIHESFEIKRLLPGINRAQRTRSFPYMLHAYRNEQGYLCFGIVETVAKTRRKLDIIAEFPKISSAKGRLSSAREKFGLCEKLLNLSPHTGPCFHYHLKQCTGACVGIESPEMYNERAQQAKEYLCRIFEHNFFIIDQGREEEELAVVLVEDGHLRGYGYLERSESIADTHTLRSALKPVSGNAETNRIIARFLSDNPKIEVLKF
ncbi:exonuclease domain-containing protein [Haliscomenobacter hydrossis]|uniref:DNA polymerase III, epsilon subunit n=2 Tax=Haliscomenobacter TaxID=2349 RepID=F4L2M2_HALH1|nr:exonuclease domain-containing protein [Haliscomenobacter hydrossis]AEE53940.1 DNA polymerase III, epsilon subunit [Haliscomenobacter hydrossis DSM 1100]